jgi:hypothetical protein
MNIQDSDEDVLFWQEIRYPERGAGSFSNIRRAEGEESRDSPPVQPQEEPRLPLGPELAPERGRSLLRTSPKDGGGASLEEDGAEAGIGNVEPESAGRRSMRRGFPPDVSHNRGDGRPWAGAVTAERPSMPPRHSASAPLPPRGSQGLQPPRRCESKHHPRRDRYDSPPQGHCGGLPRRPQAQAGGWAREPAPPMIGLGIEAMQGMTNAMNAIANQVIRNSGMRPRSSRI